MVLRAVVKAYLNDARCIEEEIRVQDVQKDLCELCVRRE
jgi:hypothetical protein